MARVKLLQNKEDLAPEHAGLFDELAALRGRISGPSTVVLYSPGLARRWNEISEYLHRESVVEGRYAELAVSVTAREYDCAYIWAAHVPSARRAGVSEETITAVRDRRPLDGLPDEEAGIVRFVRELLRDNRVSGDVFGALLQAHGPRWMVELTAWIGRYSALAGILNSFEVAPAADAEALPVGQVAPAILSHSARRALAPAPRIAPIINLDRMAEADQPVFNAVAEGRGSVRGPFALLMYSPPLCQRIFDVSNYLRFQSSLTPAERELATIATAREKDCPYVWAAHAPAARQAGIGDATIEAVRIRDEVDPLQRGESDIVDYTRQVLLTHRVDGPLFDRLHDARDVPWLVELTALIGHYGLSGGAGLRSVPTMRAIAAPRRAGRHQPALGLARRRSPSGEEGDALFVPRELTAQFNYLIADQRRLLEFEILRGRLHLTLQIKHQPHQLVPCHVTAGMVRGALLGDAAHVVVDVPDRFANALWRDAVLLVVCELNAPAPVGFVDGASHRVGDDVGIHDYVAVHVAGGAAGCLHEGTLRTQEALLVGIKNRDQAHFGKIQTFSQQIDADDHVVDAQTEVAEDLDAVERVDLRVKIVGLDTHFLQVVREVFRHLLGERSHESALPAIDACVHLVQQVIDLPFGRLNLDRRVEQTGGTDKLLNDLLRVL
jgi:4-carboxymuconolactone decarboxylase